MAGPLWWRLSARGGKSSWLAGPLKQGAIPPVQSALCWLRPLFTRNTGCCKPVRGLAVIYQIAEMGRGRARAYSNAPEGTISLVLDEAALDGAHIHFEKPRRRTRRCLRAGRRGRTASQVSTVPSRPFPPMPACRHWQCTAIRGGKPGPFCLDLRGTVEAR
jgi:hypothetical protein